MEEILPPNPEINENETKFQEAYQELQQIISILKENDFTIPEYCFSEDTIREYWDKKFPFPIVREGVDGIRVSPRREGGFNIWFTNGFENPDNSERIKITKIFREQGYYVV